MSFKSICETYIKAMDVIPTVRARRTNWPSNVHLLLEEKTTDFPLAVVTLHARGAMGVGMILVVNGETVIVGWCPSIEDVVAQDWEFVKGEW
jgi:hypothetical protein